MKKNICKVVKAMSNPVEPKPLKTWRVNLGWTVSKLAKEAGVTHPTVANAEKGETITPETAKAIADALSRAYGYTIRVSDLAGINVR